MKLGNRGFLSENIGIWSDLKRRRLKKWFRLIEGLNRAATRLLNVKPDRRNNQQLCAALLYRRALQTFQGSILLAERGMIADALTLVRSCAETAIAIGCFATDDEFADRLIEDDAKHRLTYANVILGDEYLRESLSSEEVSNLQNVVSAINKKYSNGRPKSINWADAAKDAQMGVLYNMIYRWTSGGATHITINALDRHVTAEPDHRLPYPSVIQVAQLESQALTPTFQTENRDLVLCLSGATSSILHAMNARPNLSSKGDRQARKALPQLVVQARTLEKAANLRSAKTIPESGQRARFFPA
jgi:Family of unknown function (DUF5677)